MQWLEGHLYHSPGVEGEVLSPGPCAQELNTAAPPGMFRGSGLAPVYSGLGLHPAPDLHIMHQLVTGTCNAQFNCQWTLFKFSITACL